MGITTSQFISMKLRAEAGKKSRRLDSPPDAVEREKDLHEQIRDYCKSKGWRYVSSRMDRATGQDAGIADFIIFADKSRVFCIECKTRLGKLSPEQIGFKVQLEMLGHQVHVVRGFSEFLTAITINPISK